ncbi:MAG: hypothetical protein ACOZHQ_09390 [Thermodesulfobacteriota bacterium]
MAGPDGLWAELEQERGLCQGVAVGCSECLPDEPEDLAAACAGRECAL